MFGFAFAAMFTLATFFWRSLLEAIVLSTTTAGVEALKRAKPASGNLFECFRRNLGETLSSLLTLSTMKRSHSARPSSARGAPISV